MHDIQLWSNINLIHHPFTLSNSVQCHHSSSQENTLRGQVYANGSMRDFRKQGLYISLIKVILCFKICYLFSWSLPITLRQIQEQFHYIHDVYPFSLVFPKVGRISLSQKWRISKFKNIQNVCFLRKRKRVLLILNTSTIKSSILLYFENRYMQTII